MGATLLSSVAVPGGLQQRDASSRRAVRARSAVPVRSVGHSRRALQAVAGEKLSVLVTGAGGRTGALVLDKLLSEPDTFTAKGLVRSENSAKKAMKVAKKAMKKEPAAELKDFVVGDVTDPKALAAAVAAIAPSVDVLVLLTSAAPKPKPASIFVFLFTKLIAAVVNLAKKLVAKLFGMDSYEPMKPKRMEFVYPAGGSPEEVDWLGAKAQVDAAKAAGVKKVVFVGSMGGTQVDNFLNTMAGGNILLWKRKAEAYLVNSGLDYCIIHPGGLKDTPGGERELLVGVNDTLLEGDDRSVPRADVAEVVVQCLKLNASRFSFDLASRDGPATTDFNKLLGQLSGLDTDYSLPENNPVPYSHLAFM